jgi:hypothetical protein
MEKVNMILDIKNLISRSIIILMLGLLPSQITQAQGAITYLSNLGQASTGNEAAGSDSWQAAGFFTGNNAGGYAQISIQLGMIDASGNPSGFTAMLYKQVFGAPLPGPGGSLVTLNGSLNPITAAAYIYTAPTHLTLSPNTQYFIVISGGTAVADGAYGWSVAGASSYNPSDGWSSLGGVWTSSDGSISSWISTSNFPQFAINATAVPEPSVSGLLGMCILVLCWWMKLPGERPCENSRTRKNFAPI